MKYIYMMRKNAAIAAIAATTVIALLMPPPIAAAISTIAAICKFCAAAHKLALPPIRDIKKGKHQLFIAGVLTQTCL